MAVDRRTWTFVVVGLVVTLVFAVGVSQLASPDPDGLEYVAEQQGFLDTADAHAFVDAPLADYGANLRGSDRMNTAVAGAVGMLITLGVGWGVFWLIRRRPDDDEPASPVPEGG